MGRRFKAPVFAASDVPVDAKREAAKPTISPEAKASPPAPKVLVEDEEELEELFRSEAPLQLRRGPHPALALGVVFLACLFVTALVIYTFTDSVEPTTALAAVTVRALQSPPAAGKNVTNVAEALEAEEEYKATDENSGISTNTVRPTRSGTYDES
ncbi:uncharacterized protein [Dermacentor albipictus]|uniref:uncharacterized protein n=1 Tax=Dermacentor albipictus TaxID=60249 RepID=UPI0031FBFA9D